MDVIPPAIGTMKDGSVVHEKYQAQILKITLNCNPENRRIFYPLSNLSNYLNVITKVIRSVISFYHDL
jgi:hypothetical protein